jgi:hypothetical protein
LASIEVNEFFVEFHWLKDMADIGNEWANPKKKTLATWGLINKGQTLIIINGRHGLMGVPFGSYPN